MKIFNATLVSLGVAAALGAGAVLSAATQDDNIERAARELNIMSHIFQTSFEGDSESSRRFFRQGPDARYLAGQGMVFTFNLAGMRSFWSSTSPYSEADWVQFGINMSQFAQSVVADVAASFPDMDFDFDYDYDYDYDFDGANPAPPAAPAAPGAPRGAYAAQLSMNQREIVAEMNEAMRDKQQDIQELQRDLRDLQRELRRKDENQAALNKQIQELEAALQPQLAELEDQQQAYSDFMNEVNEKSQAQQEVFNKQLTSRITQALCDYGSTLKSLKNDEHISLIFENYNDDQDQIYVFPFKDVAECTSAEKLEQAAISYLM